MLSLTTPRRQRMTQPARRGIFSLPIMHLAYQGNLMVHLLAKSACLLYAVAWKYRILGMSLFYHSSFSHAAPNCFVARCPQNCRLSDSVCCRASPTSPGATNSSPHDVPDVAHPKTVTPAARNQPAGRLASLSLGASRRQYTPGGSQEARRGSSTGVSMLPGPLPGTHAAPVASSCAGAQQC